MKKIEVEFRNITITIAGVETPTEAYDRLCGILGENSRYDVEWMTDTYVIHDKDGEPSAERSTSELFPKS
jgi:hypothetical protein